MSVRTWRIEPARTPWIRGQPLIFLATILIVWTAVRVVALYHPARQPSASSQIAAKDMAGERPGTGRNAQGVESGETAGTTHPGPAFMISAAGTGIASPDQARLAPKHLSPVFAQELLWLEATRPGPGGAAPMMIDRPIVLAEKAPSEGRANPAASPQRDLWSAYGWALARAGSNRAILANAGQYGGSQAGMIVRYRPIAGGRIRPELFARATFAPGSDDGDLAVGASLATSLPGALRLSVERRISAFGQGRQAFAAGVDGGFEVADHQQRNRLSGYGQAGIVGFSDPQPFFDLQLVGQRRVAGSADRPIALGAGIWAGGQQNRRAEKATGRPDWTYRLDAGPRASIALPVPDANMSLALDWRQRLAGNAEPESGAVVTLATSF